MESDFYFYFDFQKSGGGGFILKTINKKIKALQLVIRFSKIIMQYSKKDLRQQDILTILMTSVGKY